MYARMQFMVFKYLLFIVVLLVAASAAAQGCAPDHIDEFARITYVYDGDTVRLDDGRHIRLIGINAAETGKDGRPSEPYADEARDALSALLKPNTRVGIRFDSERRDTYHRWLAHLYTSGSQSVEAWVLENGYAALIAVPPNLWNIDCYREAEMRARTQHKGIWSLSYDNADILSLKSDSHPFHIIEGTVRHIGETDKSVWLDLESGIALRIDRRDLSYFDGVNLQGLLDERVIARGWMYQGKGQAVMRIRHPVALQLLQ